MKRIWLLLLLSSCTFGPDHEPPAVCMPENYSFMPEETETLNLSLWWEQFDDPILSGYVDDALACNYDLKIALQRIEEVRALYRIERSLLYPQIQASFVAIRARRSENLGSDVIEATTTPADIVATDFSGPLIQNFYEFGLDAAWELDIWGKNRKRAQAALYELEATQENALAVQISLIGDVATSYIDIRSLQQEIFAKKDQILKQKGLVHLAQTRYEAGLTSYLDVADAKAELETLESTLPPLQEQLSQTIHGLAIFLGQPPECFSVDEGRIPEALGKIPPDLPSTLLCRRPDIRRAERELAAATARIGVAIAELFPSFSLTGSFGTQTNMADKIFSWPSRFWTIGPTMVWNLFTGGKLLAQIRVENERQKQAILRYEQAVITALQEVEDRLVGYFQEEERLKNLHERVEANQLLRDLTYDRYVAGLINLDPVLEAERRLYIGKQELIQSTGTLMQQLIGLYKSLGGGWQCLDSP